MPRLFSKSPDRMPKSGRCFMAGNGPRQEGTGRPIGSGRPREADVAPLGALELQVKFLIMLSLGMKVRYGRLTSLAM